MPDNSKLRVLIVDDSSVMRRLLVQIFTGRGFEVVGEAADGLEALEKFEELKPDLTTLDIVMPRMRGTETLEILMQRHPEARIIMASSISDARTVVHCLKVGARQYITKPYDEEKVMTAVQKSLEK